MSHKKTYPHECTRCGCCCIAETCPTGVQEYTGLPFILGKNRTSGPCPYLTMSEAGVADCGLVSSGRIAPEKIGAGQGCCMKAAIKIITPSGSRDGLLDYAALPAADKCRAVAQIMDRKGIILHSKLPDTFGPERIEVPA